jgi:hypothetical protein
MKKHIPALLFAAVLAAPSLAVAAPQDHRPAQKRVYDRDHKDYHVWDSREEQSYRAWANEQHHANLNYAKLKRQQQSEYWAWRHAHPDGERH